MRICIDSILFQNNYQDDPEIESEGEPKIELENCNSVLNERRIDVLEGVNSNFARVFLSSILHFHLFYTLGSLTPSPVQRKIVHSSRDSSQTCILCLCYQMKDKLVPYYIFVSIVTILYMFSKNYGNFSLVPSRYHHSFST